MQPNLRKGLLCAVSLAYYLNPCTLPSMVCHVYHIVLIHFMLLPVNPKWRCFFPLWQKSIHTHMANSHTLQVFFFLDRKVPCPLPPASPPPRMPIFLGHPVFPPSPLNQPSPLDLPTYANGNKEEQQVCQRGPSLALPKIFPLWKSRDNKGRRQCPQSQMPKFRQGLSRGKA